MSLLKNVLYDITVAIICMWNSIIYLVLLLGSAQCVANAEKNSNRLERSILNARSTIWDLPKCTFTRRVAWLREAIKTF